MYSTKESIRNSEQSCTKKGKDSVNTVGGRNAQRVLCVSSYSWTASCEAVTEVCVQQKNKLAEQTLIDTIFKCCASVGFTDFHSSSTQPRASARTDIRYFVKLAWLLTLQWNVTVVYLRGRLVLSSWRGLIRCHVQIEEYGLIPTVLQLPNWNGKKKLENQNPDVSVKNWNSNRVVWQETCFYSAKVFP